MAVQEKQMDSYDRIADIKRLDFITDTLKSNIPADGKVLDVGCGNGVISRYLGGKGYDVLGIDVSDKAIEKARQFNKHENVKFDCKSAEELVADGAKYDAIICSEVLEHLDNPSLLLEQLYLSLKDSGRLIVTVPNGKGPREMFVTKPVLYFRDNKKGMWNLVLKMKKVFGFRGTTNQSAADNLDHIQFFSKKDLLELSRKNNFSILQFKNSNFVDDVFPFSIFANRIKFLQKVDCKVADFLPNSFTGGFLTVWAKGQGK